MTPSESNPAVPSADELRLVHLQKQMEEMDRREKLREAERQERSRAAEEFLKGEVSDKERELIRRLVMNAVEKGEFEAMVYSFPSKLCTDQGRAINNADPDWPETLQGKARVFYERFKENLQPKGYKLKAMIINFPDGMPGDVGFFLDWAPKAV
ncbi:histidine kinase [Paracoccus aestuariivivens]|uniref:Histidine kinase n=1 Tax=Paracoccus aestuariivivens TaxID=1820333 RepID=A0A6L6J567_9RHOB|nr:histidine kinase [Paracoccus aestuariivivens]MTH77030.1 histidine kinase [Paracoccus aestuariivivens]